MSRFQRVFTWAMTVGAICFAVGFFGPIIWAPDANQGPLLGIFITGPLGFLLGLVIGIVREILGAGRPVPTAGTGNVSPAPPPRAPVKRVSVDELISYPIARAILGLMSLYLLFQGASSLGDGGRGPAAAIMLGVVVAWTAATGRIPRWSRR